MSSEPCAEWIPAELVSGSVPSHGELDTATVDCAEGITTMGVTDGGWMACELVPVHDHADICKAAFVCER